MRVTIFRWLIVDIEFYHKIVLVHWVTIFRQLIVDIGFYHKVVLVQRDALMKFLLNNLPDIFVDFLLLALNVEIIILFRFGKLLGFILISQSVACFVLLPFLVPYGDPASSSDVPGIKLASLFSNYHLLQLMMIWLVILTRREEMRTELLK